MTKFNCELKVDIMVSFNYNASKGYIDVRFVDDVIQDEVISMINRLIESDEYPRDLKILIDASKGNLSLKPNQLYKIFEENVKMFSKYFSLKVALIMWRPVDTALALIYTGLCKVDKYKYQVFSTKAAAEIWLDNGGEEMKHSIKPNAPRPGLAK